MKGSIKVLLLSLFYLPVCSFAVVHKTEDYSKYRDVIKKCIYKDYKETYRPAGGALTYPFLSPGSVYANDLWDWDSWLSDIAMRQILADLGSEKESREAQQYERGCVLNFLSFSGSDGWVPIVIQSSSDLQKIKPDNINNVNMHKPCLAQHAAFLTQMNNGDAEWLREKFLNLQYFVKGYENRYRDAATGLYFWKNDVMIGVDNDPCTFFRPDGSSASILLNCFMYKELKAMTYLCGRLDFKEKAEEYNNKAEDLKTAIQENCWDERDGFFYSVDLNLKPVVPGARYHSGAPRTWNCLIQRIGVWSGFLTMWADIATPEQAKRMVEENYKNTKTFNAPYGVRSLSKMEKMYCIKASGNPSCWLGPVWGISNYMVWRGLVKYGFIKEARELASKSIVLFGKDFEKNGLLHEYYHPESGAPIVNPGFKNWNYLVLNMLDWMDGKKVVAEF